MKKEQQHYVWKKYLKSWANESNQVYCKRNDIVFITSVDKIAKEKYFYELTSISKDDYFFVKNLFTSNKYIDKNPLFDVVFGIYEKSFDENSVINEKEVDEELMTFVENLGSTILDKFLSESTYMVKEENLPDFYVYIAFQLMRTPRFKNAFRIDEHPKLKEQWNIIRNIAAFNFAEHIFFENYQIIKLYNRNDDFITSDQPVINIRADYEKDKQVIDTELFYPISPKLGLLISNKISNKNSIELSSEQVRALNYKMMKASHKILLGNKILKDMVFDDEQICIN